MPRCVCAVFDPNEDYIRRFSGYIKKRDDLLFTLFSFTKRQSLEDFVNTHKADLILVPDDDGSPGLKEDLLKIVKEKTCVAVLADGQLYSGSFRCINKYQSMTGIISEMTDILSENERLTKNEDSLFKNAKITGIYSFGHLDKAAELALDLAEAGPEQKKTLYINLTRFSGLKEKLPEPPKGSVSDFIYYFKNGSGKIKDAYLNARGRLRRADVILCPQDPEDIEQIGEENWREFISCLISVSGAVHVIWDLSEGIKNLAEAFSLCGRIYLICDRKKDAARICELQRYLEEQQRPDLFSRISEVEI